MAWLPFAAGRRTMRDKGSVETSVASNLPGRLRSKVLRPAGPSGESPPPGEEPYKMNTFFCIHSLSLLRKKSDNQQQRHGMALDLPPEKTIMEAQARLRGFCPHGHGQCCSIGGSV